MIILKSCAFPEQQKLFFILFVFFFMIVKIEKEILISTHYIEKFPTCQSSYLEGSLPNMIDMCQNVL